MKQEDFYTVESGNKIHFDYNDAKLGKKPVIFQFPHCPVVISPQQLAELGALFLALSGGQFDADSITELLDGFKLPVPKIVSQWSPHGYSS